MKIETSPTFMLSWLNFYSFALQFFSKEVTILTDCNCSPLCSFLSLPLLCPPCPCSGHQ